MGFFPFNNDGEGVGSSLESAIGAYGRGGEVG